MISDQTQIFYVELKNIITGISYLKDLLRWYGTFYDACAYVMVVDMLIQLIETINGERLGYSIVVIKNNFYK